MFSQLNIDTIVVKAYFILDTFTSTHKNFYYQVDIWLRNTWLKYFIICLKNSNLDTIDSFFDTARSTLT